MATYVQQTLVYTKTDSTVDNYRRISYDNQCNEYPGKPHLI